MIHPHYRYPALAAGTFLLGVLTLLGGPSPASAQPNDECTAPTAVPVTSLPFSETVDTTAATTLGSDPTPSCASPDNNIWYSFTANGATSLEILAAGLYDTNISVYTGGCGSLIERACNDDTPVGTDARAIVALDGGESVLIAVASSGGGGVVVVTLQESTPTFRNPKSVTDVVLSNDVTPLGGGYGPFLQTVALSNKDIGFSARTEGIFVRAGGVLTTIAASGDASPIGGTFHTFGAPSLKTGGEIKFYATVEGVTPDEGFFSFTGGAVAKEILLGDLSPDGGTYSKLHHFVVLAESGAFAFIAETTSSGGARRLFVRDGASTTIMASEGDPSPCGGTFDRLGRTGASPGGFDLADASLDVAFYARTDAGNEGVYAANIAGGGGSVIAVACEGDATPLGGTHRSISQHAAINSLGEVYFAGRITGGAANNAVWVYDGTSTTSVAADGDVLPSGAVISGVDTEQVLATNGNGDVAFFAALVGTGEAVFLRPAGAPAPGAVVGNMAACSVGGTFENLDDEVDIGPGGEIAFDGACTGGLGSFVVPFGGIAAPRGLVTNVTSLGAGFQFIQPSINATGDVAFRGRRTAIYGMRCNAAGCNAPFTIAGQSAAVVGLPGHHVDVLFGDTLSGTGKEQAFLGVVAGGTLGEGVLRVKNGTVSAIEVQGSVLPGGAGVFADFPFSDPFYPQSAGPAAGKRAVAFYANVTHPTATHGLFATTNAGTQTIALDGDAAPTGGVFSQFGFPVIRGKSVTFRADTDVGDTCIYFVRNAAAPVIVSLACVGDVVLTGGGTIASFPSPPSGSKRGIAFAAEIAGGPVQECMIAKDKGGALRVILCDDDILVNGTFVESVSDLSGLNGPVVEAKGKGMLMQVNDDVNNGTQLIAERKGVLFPILNSGVTPAPVGGGTIFYGDTTLPSMAKRSIAFHSTIGGGPARAAVIRATIK